MSIWHGLKKYFKLDYEDLPTTSIEETYHYSAPIPDCEITRCFEERYQQGKVVHPYCKHHYDMVKQGLAINCVCEYPPCWEDVLDSNLQFCVKHC